MSREHRRLVLGPMLTIALVCMAAGARAEVQFTGQGIVYSARTGGDAVAVDAQGSAYVVETGTCPADPTARPGIYEGYTTGARWLVKIDRDARTVLYRILLGCSGEGGGLLGVDPEGNAYVAGIAAPGSFVPTTNFSVDANADIGFLTKLDAAGGVVYSVGLGEAWIYGIAFDRAGNVYLTGSADDAFPTTAGAYQPVAAGAGDAFVLKLNAAGTQLAYSTLLGGTSVEGGTSIAVDAGGHAYVGGYTWSPDFPTTPGPLNQPDSRPFVAKLNPTGTDVLYSARIGGSGASLSGLAVNDSGQVYVAGATTGTAIPVTAAASLTTKPGQEDGWLVKLDFTTQVVVFGTYVGGSGFDRIEGAAVDASGMAYVWGETSADGHFPVTPRALQTTPLGETDGFVTSIDGAGRIVYSTRLGGSAKEWWIQGAIDMHGDVYVTGYSGAVDSGYDPAWWSDFAFSPDAVATGVAVDIEHHTARGFIVKLVPRVSLAESAVASSMENASLGPANAIDGHPQTRWSSEFGDGESLYIRLRERVVIDRIVLDWETAHGASYEIRVADAAVLDDGVPWTTVHDTTTGDGGIDDVRSLFITATHIWLLGRQRATPWGYSLWEMAVFGTPADSDNLPPTVTLTAPADGAHFVGPIALEVTAAATDSDGEVTRVDFLVGGSVVATDSIAPYAVQWTFVAGSHTVSAVAFDDDGVRSTGWTGAGITVESGQVGGNLALQRPAVASSTEAAAFAPAHVSDGSPDTRWSSMFSDPQWIAVDLGNRFYINTVVLKWETAYAATFELQMSDDGVRWETFLSGSGSPGVQTLTGLNGLGRFVRMYGTSRATPWGYSLWEFGVYGTLYTGVRNVAAGKPTVASSVEKASLGPSEATDAITSTRWSSQWADHQWISVDLGTIYDIEDIILRWETAFASSYLIQVSNDATTWRLIRQVESDGGTDQISNVRETARFVRIYGVTRATGWGISLWELEVYGREASLFLTPTTSATASSTERPGLDPARAIDGDGQTRWSSEFADDQWIAVQLWGSVLIRRLVLHWETAFASAYYVQVSEDGATWQTVFETNTGDGGTDDISLSAAGRYVRVWCSDRATPWGASLWELEVYSR